MGWASNILIDYFANSSGRPGPVCTFKNALERFSCARNAFKDWLNFFFRFFTPRENDEEIWRQLRRRQNGGEDGEERRRQVS
jgi:hypothetical protein